MVGNNEFFEKFERNKYLKKLTSMHRVNFLFLRLCQKKCPLEEEKKIGVQYMALRHGRKWAFRYNT